MRLNEMQDLFGQMMLAAPEAVQNPAADLTALFATPQGILPERIAIYRSNVVNSLIDVMIATYPLIVKLTGEEFATSMMRGCVLANPPREACLAHYGAALPDYIAGFAPAAGLPYLADVARLEWVMNESHYAPDDRPLAAEELQSIAMDGLADMKLRLRTSARLMSSRWPLESIRTFCTGYDENKSETLDLEGAGVQLLVYRPNLAVEIAALDSGEYVCLEALYRGETLGSAIEAAARNFPAFDLSSVLQRHIKLQTFRSLHD